MNKLRKALLELFFIGTAIGIVMCVVGRNISSPASIIAVMLTGFLFSPIAWAIYRMGRFMFFPNRSASAGWR